MRCARPARRRWRRRTAAPAKAAAGTAEMPAMPSVQSNVIASIAPSAAPAETPSVNGVASGIAQQPLKDDAGRGERGADERARQRARQPRDEEDLRVDVVGKRHRPVERAPQVDRRRSDERRQHDCGERQQHRSRPWRPRCAGGSVTGEPPDVHAPHRHDDEMAGAGVRLDLGLHAVERADVGRRQHVRPSARRRARVRPSDSTSVRHRPAAKLRSCVETTIAIGVRRCRSRRSAATSS